MDRGRAPSRRPTATPRTRTPPTARGPPGPPPRCGASSTRGGPPGCRGSEALTRSGTRIAALEEEERLLAARITELDQQVAQLVEAEGRLAAEVEAAGAALEHGEAEVAAAEAAHREAEARATAWTARVEALAQALDAARAKAGAEHLGNVDGVLGSLAGPGGDRAWVGGRRRGCPR